MKTPHTPGPWYATGPHVQSASINEDNYVCKAEGNDTSQIEANACLIAAAPNMLTALKEAQETLRASRHRFPKSIKHRETFQLNLALAAIGSAIHNATTPQA